MDKTERAETYLGNVGESVELAARVSRARQNDSCLEVSIGRGDRAKGRILTQSASGQSVGIAKTRDWLLRDGDVLATDRDRLVLVSLAAQQLMVLRFEEGVRNQAIALVHLGHTLGNQHWPITVQGEALYVELVAEAALVESTIRKVAKRLSIEGLQIDYEMKSPGEFVEFLSLHSHAH
ncbi:MAG: hypothetical protein WA885_02405 [Phormidesmis sp.]